MRFREEHKRLGTLIEDMRLETEISEFEFETRFFLRGGGLFDSASCQEKFNLYKHEKGMKPGELIQYAFEKIFEPSCEVSESFKKFISENDPKKRTELLENFKKEYEEKFKYDQHIDERAKQYETENVGIQPHDRLHTPLYNIGFWNIISLLLSSEAYHLARDAIGYDSLLSAWNAAEAIPYFIDDYIDDHYNTIKGGMKRLITKLQEQLEGKIQIRCGHVLESITFDPRNFQETAPCISLRFQNGAVYRCNRVVLALPRLPLEKLKVAGSSEWGKFRRVSMSVRGEPAFKCFLAYKEAWWSKYQESPWEDCKCYRICTDLPLRQVYLFPDKWLKATHGVETDYSLVMASYSDAHYTNFWRSMLSAENASYRERKDFDSEKEFQRVRPFLASRRMVQYIIAQLFKIFGCYNEHGEVKNDGMTRVIAHPEYALYKDWSPENGEAGWHFWQVHHRRDVVERVINRLAKYDGICICGEAYSDQQGWIEGALEATCRVLGEAGLGEKADGPEAGGE